MADLSLLNITPHQVSRDMRGYSVFFYGEPKSGKTTIASKFPKHLILAFEKGYSAIPGAMAQPINTWGEFKKVLRQLKDETVRERFETIIIDTTDIAWDYAEKFICDNHGVDTIGDIPYGKGYKLLAKEFDTGLRTIVQLNYGLVLISHAEDKIFTDESGAEYNQIVPTLDKRPRNIVSRLCDIIGYARPIQDEAGNLSTKLFLRGTPRFMAGSRFKYTPDFIDFTYPNLVNAIGDAIDREMEDVGTEYFTDKRENAYIDDTQPLDYDMLIVEFNSIITSLVDNFTEEEFNEFWAPRVSHIVEQYLGKGKKVSNTTRDQVEAVDLIVSGLKDLLAQGMPSEAVKATDV
jgi:AAA domain